MKFCCASQTILTWIGLDHSFGIHGSYSHGVDMISTSILVYIGLLTYEVQALRSLDVNSSTRTSRHRLEYAKLNKSAIWTWSFWQTALLRHSCPALSLC